MSSVQTQTHHSASLRPCRQFKDNGTCSYGPKCKFAHVGRKVNKPPPTAATKSQKKRGQNKSSKRSKRADPRSHIKTFFAQYPAFGYNSSEPVMSEFYRMCDMFGWRKGSKESEESEEDEENEKFKEAREGIKDALTKQFNEIYGTDVNDLAAWQKLCTIFNLPDIPNEVGACRRLVKKMYVNIVDLVDTPVTQEPVEHFESERRLSEYTRETGKYFPRDNIHAGDLLGYLLRQIMHPGNGKYRPRKRRPKK